MKSVCSAIAFIFIIVFSFSQLQAQYSAKTERYYQYTNASFKARDNGRTDSAIYYGRLAIKADPDNNKLYNYLGNLLLKKRAYNEAVAVFQADILMGNIPGKFENIFDDYDSIRQRPEIVAFQQKIPALVTDYYKNKYNIAFGNMIYQMLGRDQAIRKYENSLVAEDSLRGSVAASMQAWLDTGVNLPLLMAHFKTHDFPRYNEMDKEVSSSFGVIIHHLLCYNHTPAIDELHRLVQAAVYEGKYSPYAYMLALDWHHINRTGKQLYGTYIGSVDGTNYIFDPVIDSLSSVDMRRAKWKQRPLKDVPLSDWRHPEMPEGYNPQ